MMLCLLQLTHQLFNRELFSWLFFSLFFPVSMVGIKRYNHPDTKYCHLHQNPQDNSHDYGDQILFFMI